MERRGRGRRKGYEDGKKEGGKERRKIKEEVKENKDLRKYVTWKSKRETNEIEGKKKGK